MDNYQLYITTYTLKLPIINVNQPLSRWRKQCENLNELPPTAEGIDKIEAEMLPLILQQ